ncbi:FG-GAP-like repeat-containing protein [Desulfocapsa sulfexigens]|nr:FG-GAP-like repeat-containing protein [Desulfocapsa sulfexigens]
MMDSSLKKSVVIFLMSLVCSVATTAVFATEVRQVVFYPTDVSDAGDFAYLRDSVRLMLASRLSAVAGGEVRFEDGVNKGRDFTFFRVMSSVVSTKEGIRLSVKAFKPSEDVSLQFQSMANESTEIMKALDVLVEDVGTMLFQVEPPKAIIREPEKEEKDVADMGTSHPDRVYKSTSGFGLSINQDEFVSQTEVEVKATERYKSKVLPFLAKCMTAGDIDGDLHDEIIVSTNTKLYIYRLRDEKIELLDTVALPGGLKVHAVNVADLDNNGVMEIYLSSTRKEEPRSSILEWHPVTGVKWLYENVYWYLRPVNIPGEGVVLAGQQSGVSGMTAPGIYRLTAGEGGKVAVGERFSLPESVDLFDFVFADFGGDKMVEVATINKKEQLQVYNSDLKLLYTSPSGFGGKELLKEYTAHIRLVVSDFDNNGHDDILIVDNELYSPEMMNKTRLYKNGQVRGLSWDGVGFAEVWHTNLFPNSIIDFQFFSTSKIDGVGIGRLFIVEPEKGDLLEKIFLGAGGSRLSVYGMNFIPKRN